MVLQKSLGKNAPPISYALDWIHSIAVGSGGNDLFGYLLGDEGLVFKLNLGLLSIA